MAWSMFDFKILKNGYVTSGEIEDLVEGMDKILGEEFAKRDAEINKLRGELETERRLRLGMKRR